jgi:hypothetical protein
MLGVRYFKAPPTAHVILYRQGRVIREGPGLSFFYYVPRSVVAQVPLTSSDVPFVFNEVTADFQDVTMQGELTYRLTNPLELAGLLDFSVDPKGRYVSDDPSKLNDRLVHACQILARTYLQRRSLREVLGASEELLSHILRGLKTVESVTALGVEVLGLSILGVKATPEMAKALQAEARERLLQEADQAVFHRRNAAIEAERTIQENELQTEIAVQQKQREVRETKLHADIAVEQQRVELVNQQVENQAKEAQARSTALRATLEPLKDVDWRILMASRSDDDSARQMIAMAFRDLADGAQIGHLNITPDLLSNLMGQE